MPHLTFGHPGENVSPISAKDTKRGKNPMKHLCVVVSKGIVFLAIFI